MAHDELGNDARYDDWIATCRMPDSHASDQTRVTSAKALQIAVDVLHAVYDNDGDTGPWTMEDITLALGALAGIRAQQGVTGPDADALGEPDGIYLTRYMDICIYG